METTHGWKLAIGSPNPKIEAVSDTQYHREKLLVKVSPERLVMRKIGNCTKNCKKVGLAPKTGRISCALRGVSGFGQV